MNALRELSDDGRKVVVLDDDPTGTQTVSCVDVILHPSEAAYRAFFRGSERTVYVLTNSRSLSQPEAVQLVRSIRLDVERVARETGHQVAFVLRGDSTLRGHIFAEMDVFAVKDSVGLFVPAFPEGGRVTVDGVHYLEDGMRRVPVAHTEFARDSVFGYSSERMIDWVAEVGGGRPAIALPLAKLRQEGAEAVADSLLHAPAGSVIVPDAQTSSDVETIVRGLLTAEKRGRSVVVRSASTFAAIRGGLHGETLRSAPPGSAGRTLVVCGSHTAAAGRQLQKFLELTGIQQAVIPTDRLLNEGVGTILPDVVERLDNGLKRDGLAVLATERVRSKEHGDLSTGAMVMEAVVAAVRQVAPRCDTVIAKGGITSAATAVDGMNAVTARVRGQLEPGVSLWDLRLEDGRTLPYAVIPGNVGHEGTIRDTAERLGVELAYKNRQ